MFERPIGLEWRSLVKEPTRVFELSQPRHKAQELFFLTPGALQCEGVFHHAQVEAE